MMSALVKWERERERERERGEREREREFYVVFIKLGETVNHSRVI